MKPSTRTKQQELNTGGVMEFTTARSGKLFHKSKKKPFKSYWISEEDISLTVITFNHVSDEMIFGSVEDAKEYARNLDNEITDEEFREVIGL